MYDGRAGACAIQDGRDEYNGWAGVHAKLVKRPLRAVAPAGLEQMQFASRGRASATRVALTEAGAAAASASTAKASHRGGIMRRGPCAPSGRAGAGARRRRRAPACSA